MWPIFQYSRRMYIRHRSQWLLLPCPTMHCDRKHRSGRHWIQSGGLHRKLHGTRTTPGRHRINFRCSDWIFKYVPENILFKIFQLFYFYLKCTNFLLFEQTFCVLQLSHSSMLMVFFSFYFQQITASTRAKFTLRVRLGKMVATTTASASMHPREFTVARTGQLR